MKMQQQEPCFVPNRYTSKKYRRVDNFEIIRKIYPCKYYQIFSLQRRNLPLQIASLQWKELWMFWYYWNPTNLHIKSRISSHWLSRHDCQIPIVASECKDVIVNLCGEYFKNLFREFSCYIVISMLKYFGLKFWVITSFLT